MSAANPMRLVRREKDETRQEKALREIQERLKVAEFGMGAIDNTPLANAIQPQEVLKSSYRLTDAELAAQRVVR